MIDKQDKYLNIIEKIYEPIEKINKEHKLSYILKSYSLHDFKSKNNISTCPNCGSHLIESKKNRYSCPNCGYQLLL